MEGRAFFRQVIADKPDAYASRLRKADWIVRGIRDDMREADWSSADGAIRLYRGDCLRILPEIGGGKLTQL